MANRALYSLSSSALTPPFIVNDVALNSAAASNNNIFDTATGFSLTAAGFDGALTTVGASSGNDTGFLSDYQLDGALYLNSGNTATLTITGLNDARTHRIRVSGSFVGANEDRIVNVNIGATNDTYISANSDGSGNISDGVEIDATPSGGSITVTITVSSGSVGYVSGIDVLELAPFYGFNNLLIVGASIMAQTYDNGTDIVNRFDTTYPDAGGWTVYGRAVAGWTTTDLRNNIDAILADYVAVQDMVVLVHTGGNNISLTRPYSSTTQTEQDTITDDVTYICDAIEAAGFIPVLADVTFRNYDNVDPLDDTTYANGSEPYNLNLYRPLALTYSPFYSDVNGDSFMSFYYFMLNNYAQYIGSDGIHPTTIGRAALRQRIVDTIGFTAAYNVDPEQLSLNIVQSGGTAQRVFHINYGGDPYGAPETINTIADDSGSLLSLTDVNDASAGYGVTIGNYNSNSPNTAGAASADNTGFLYDTVLAQSFYLQSGITAFNVISGLDDAKLYNLRISGSRGAVSGRRTQIEIGTGTGGEAAQDYGTDDGANGANYIDGVEFTNITPVGGVIQFNATVSTGTYGYVGGFDFIEQGEVAPEIISGSATAETDTTLSTITSYSISSGASAETQSTISTAVQFSISMAASAETDTALSTNIQYNVSASGTAETDASITTVYATQQGISSTASAETDSSVLTLTSYSIAATGSAETDTTLSTVLLSANSLSGTASAETDSNISTTHSTPISASSSAETDTTLSTTAQHELSAAASAETDSSVVAIAFSGAFIAATASAETDAVLSTVGIYKLASTGSAETDSSITTSIIDPNSFDYIMAIDVPQRIHAINII